MCWLCKQRSFRRRSDEVIAELLALNGSSAGARPKALIGVDKERKIFRMELIS
jgi:hypothetical protein